MQTLYLTNADKIRKILSDFLLSTLTPEMMENTLSQSLLHLEPGEYTKRVNGMIESLDITILGGEVISLGDKKRGFIAKGYTIAEVENFFNTSSKIMFRNHHYHLGITYRDGKWMVDELREQVRNHPNTLIIRACRSMRRIREAKTNEK